MIDLSPGSGQLAKACLSEEVLYHGFCQNAPHMHFCANIADRFSLSLITSEGTSLYQQELAEMVAALYADILESQKEGADEDTMSEGDGN